MQEQLSNRSEEQILLFSNPLEAPAMAGVIVKENKESQPVKNPVRGPQKAQLLRRWRLDPSILEHAILKEMDGLNIHYAEPEGIF